MLVTAVNLYLLLLMMQDVVTITSLGINATAPNYPHNTYVVLSAVPSATGMNLTVVRDPTPPAPPSAGQATWTLALVKTWVRHLPTILADSATGMTRCWCAMDCWHCQQTHGSRLISNGTVAHLVPAPDV